ncbi:hypothetical protein LS73_002860 [Helicobacter muridarum]|uniref:Uncharacterized protein n=1 Tax=Helicobacter muridarum TaxID=216 RepID=A0A099TZ51_9HELI|nr:hypothetical protein [Helicobacter muridarum]TLE00858.1 hypothetical protein LS73_002860 [Helicobacter muridarum]STQ86629.1 Uncharacterised protein [Helicobacter muridarum]
MKNKTMQPIYKALAKIDDETSIFAQRVGWFDRLATFTYQPSQYKRITIYYESQTEYFNLAVFINPQIRITTF